MMITEYDQMIHGFKHGVIGDSESFFYGQKIDTLLRQEFLL